MKRLGVSYDYRAAAPELSAKLIAALEAHFEHNYPIGGKHLAALRQLLDSGASPYVRNPRVPKVYRGLTVTRRWCLAHRIDPDGVGPQSTHFKLGSATKAISWSASAKVARGYFELDDRDIRHVLLIADVSDNTGVFASGPGGLYLIAGDRQRIDKEMLALWPVTVGTVEVFHEAALS